MNPLWIIVAEMAGLLVVIVAPDVYVATGRARPVIEDRIERVQFGYFMFMFATLGVIAVAKGITAA